MEIIATIRHNDPEVEERIGLGIVAENDGYAVRSESGEDAGQYRWATEIEARAAISHLWQGCEWDLIWE